jgi:hypothetical protein
MLTPFVQYIRYVQFIGLICALCSAQLSDKIYFVDPCIKSHGSNCIERENMLTEETQT